MKVGRCGGGIEGGCRRGGVCGLVMDWGGGGGGGGGGLEEGGFVLTPGLDGGEVLVERTEAAELAHEHVGGHRGVQAADAQRCVLLRPANSNASPAQFHTLTLRSECTQQL